MEIKELDIVKLKDGREGTVVHLYRDDKAVEVDFDEMSETVGIEKIEMIIWSTK